MGPLMGPEINKEMVSMTKVCCSFCGKDQSEVESVVAGPNVFICDGCIETAQQAVDGMVAARAVPPAFHRRARSTSISAST